MAIFYHLVIITAIYVILASSLNLILGYAGQFSVAHGAFYGIGAYAGVLFVMHFGVPFWLEILIAGCVASLFAFLIAYPTLRLKGDYLALATFAFAIIIFSVMDNWFDLTRGPLGISGIPQAKLFGISFESAASYMVLVLIFMVITLICLWRIVTAPFGKVLTAIREDETATLSIGKNVARFKVLSFVVGAFFAGLAGVLYSHYFRFIDPSSFALSESFLIFSMVVFGGMGTLRGSIAGAAIMVIIPEILRYLGIPSFYAGHIRQMLFGGLIIFVILRRPQGLMGVKEF